MRKVKEKTDYSLLLLSKLSTDELYRILSSDDFTSKTKGLADRVINSRRFQ